MMEIVQLIVKRCGILLPFIQYSPIILIEERLMEIAAMEFGCVFSKDYSKTLAWFDSG